MRGEVADVDVVARVAPALRAVAVVGRRRREAERGLARPGGLGQLAHGDDPVGHAARRASRRAPGCRGRPDRRRSARGRAPAACRRAAPRPRGRCRPCRPRPAGGRPRARRGASRERQQRARAAARGRRRDIALTLAGRWTTGDPSERIRANAPRASYRRVPARAARRWPRPRSPTRTRATCASRRRRRSTRSTRWSGTLAAEYRLWALNYDLLIGFDAKTMRPDTQELAGQELAASRMTG